MLDACTCTLVCVIVENLTWSVSGSVFLDVDEAFKDTVMLNIAIPNVTTTTMKVPVTGDKLDYKLALSVSCIIC